MHKEEPTLTGRQAAEAQTALRQALGLEPEQFPVPAFIGMVSGEIEQLRARGDQDEKIASLISDATGVPITAETVARFYASAEERGRPHGE